MFFRDLIGQERPLNFLKTALRTGQLSHAYLFLGGEGVGKASAAQALARALNCEQRRPDQDACGQCRSCRWFAGGNHPDFIRISPLTEGARPQIRIDQIRELRRQLGYRPLAGGWRVILIKPAEAMNEPAANALLKALEEPPPGNLLILTAVTETDLLPTIVSRCRRLAFAPLPLALVVQELIRRRGLEPEPARLLAALSGGSLGRALEFDVEELIAQRDQVIIRLAELSEGNTSEVLEWAATLAKDTAGLDTFLLLARLWYLDLLALQVHASEARLANQDRLTELQQMRDRFAPEVLFQRLEALARAERQLRANLNVELTLDILGLCFQAASSGTPSRG